jgi:hypothetical protein
MLLVRVLISQEVMEQFGLKSSPLQMLGELMDSTFAVVLAQISALYQQPIL